MRGPVDALTFPRFAGLPTFVPPEAGGLTSRELVLLLRGVRDLRLVSADVLEVCPAYDHAEITAVAAAHAVYELLALEAALEEWMESRMKGGACRHP